MGIETWNPLDKNANMTLSNNDLTARNSAGSDGHMSIRSVTGYSSGKYYAEITTVFSGAWAIVGIGTPSANINSYAGCDNYSYSWQSAAGGVIYHEAGYVNYNVSFGTNNAVGILLDMDAKTLTFYKNGVSQGLAASGIHAGTYHLMASIYYVGTTATINATGPFYSGLPSGATAWAILPPPTPLGLKQRKQQSALRR